MGLKEETTIFSMLIKHLEKYPPSLLFLDTYYDHGVKIQGLEKTELSENYASYRELVRRKVLDLPNHYVCKKLEVYERWEKIMGDEASDKKGFVREIK